MTRAATLLAFAIALTGCGGGGGTIGVAPGVSDLLTPAPRATATPTPGAVTIGTPAFPTGNASGSCTGSGLTFNAAGASAIFTVSQPNYTGAFTIASNASPNVASAAVNGATVTVTALAAGSTTIVVAGDAHGASASCAVGVTTTNGSVQ